MATTKTSQNKHGSFVFTRYDEIQSFKCERCKESKKAKIVVQWTDNTNQQKTICNGCYGFLMAEKS
jgi:hypothetical protein